MEKLIGEAESENMIDVIINNSGNTAKVISIIRKYNSELSIGMIRSKIEKHEIILTHDISGYVDICDELNGIDRNALFLKLIDELTFIGAEVELYENGELISYEMLCNLIQTWDEICEDVELDMEREVGCDYDDDL